MRQGQRVAVLGEERRNDRGSTGDFPPMQTCAVLRIRDFSMQRSGEEAVAADCSVSHLRER